MSKKYEAILFKEMRTFTMIRGSLWGGGGVPSVPMVWCTYLLQCCPIPPSILSSFKVGQRTNSPLCTENGEWGKSGWDRPENSVWEWGKLASKGQITNVVLSAKKVTKRHGFRVFLPNPTVPMTLPKPKFILVIFWISLQYWLSNRFV